ncbi:gluconolactonase [Aureimonas sp. SA4125]|uniref:SMP-30/gluconolactonase/LRE family protein n=1 Tax=Aureimonas sp. SA4125 TaxID=2826993 RepID=UPI001CC7F5D4|nr:SMP-30/gluconolactonase/LRE family protein [Aureimonas sp. SA4125]BDA86923.1 gluconolactonase [Aureimonas sp. SA4125]
MRIKEPYDIRDERFGAIVMNNVDLHQLTDECAWAEGPVFFGDGNFLLWSDIPTNRILRWIPGVGTSVFRADSGNSNGHTRDRQGRLVSCEHRNRRVSRTEYSGAVTVLADRFDGKRLNSPNDVVVRRDGSVWFTDPSYGILSQYEGDQAEPEQPCRGVYRIDPAGRVDRVVDDFNQPNGLAFSPDERILYIADSGASHDGSLPRHIRAFDVSEDGRLSNGRVFSEIVDAGIPDGIRVDTAGRVWSSARDGVHCFSPEGTLLGKILVPETVANLTFGGPKKNQLFIAATRSIYSIFVNAEGA